MSVEPKKPLFVVCRVFKGENKLLDQFVEINQEEENFAQLYTRLTTNIEGTKDDSVQAFISQTAPPLDRTKKSAAKHGTVAPLSAPVNLVRDFSCKYITYHVEAANEESGSHMKQNAFDVLMKAQQNDSYLPQKIDKEKLIATERLYNMVVDYLEEVNAGFTHDYVESCGKRVATVLRDALWYLDAHHAKFKERSIVLPKAFEKFQNLNKWKQNKHMQPSLTQEGLSVHEQSMSALLMLPMVLSQRNSVLAHDMSDLCKAMMKYRLYLQQSSVRVENCRSSTVPVRTPSTHSALTTKPASAVCPPQYQELQRHLDRNAPYTPVDLGDFVTVDRYERRKYIANIQLVSDVSMYVMPYGNCLGSITILWKIERNSENHESRNAGVMLEVSKELPIYSTREMRRSFIKAYSEKASVKPMVLRAIFRELVNDSAAAESYRQEAVDDRVIRFFVESEHPDLLLDLRKLNGNPGSSMFNTFWEEAQKYFEEHAQVHERRHNNFTYMPVAISVEELRLRVTERLPEGTAIPSTEWLRLQFWPANPYAARAIKHTFRLDVKFAVQTRLLRSEHIDSKYATTQYKYLKQFACKYKDHARLVCVDDKAIVPVGNPSQPVSTGVRGHNRSVVPVDGTLAALDHDWHLGGLVPSVVLLTDIPERAEDSFYRGKVCVTVKEKVFQPSSPSRHTAELAKVLREYASVDDVNLDVPILLIFSDGGPDHRVTFHSVKMALLALFLALDLDALYAARCAPHGSWINPAERTMSLLNLALQNVALERGRMSEELEKVIRGKTDLRSVRQASERHADLKDAFKASMQPVIKLTSERFSRMRLKQEKVKSFAAAADEEIEEVMSLLSFIDEQITASDAITMTAKDLARSEKLTRFLETHSRQTHYTFQLKKCASPSCSLCVLNPPRLPPRVFDTLSFLPDPMLDASGEHYQSFDDLYGRPTTEENRPSLKQPTQKSETDKRRKQLLTAAKVRDVISCGECQKPRCVYAASKLHAGERSAVTRAQQDGTYVCGGDIFAEGGRYYDNIVTRVDLTCASPVETQYYGSVTVAFPACCYHCGTQGNLLENSDPYMAELRQSFHTVRPICRCCHAGGKVAQTRGPTNARKKHRK